MCQTRTHAIAASAAALMALASCAFGAEAPPKKVVLIAGTVHQGPGGHPSGTHEYELTTRLLKHVLDQSFAASVKTELHFDGWPRDPATLDDADTIVVVSDGADRALEDHPLFVGDRLAQLKKQMDRGCGLVAIHWTVFIPQKHGEAYLDWIGGYFDYESGPAPRNWYSKIQTADTTCQPASPQHPICRGLAPFKLREEYYYNIRFRPGDPRLVPILSTPIPGETGDQVVAWAVERAGGGRGFGFTGGHFFDNWDVENFRRMVVNAILWTAHVEVPPGGAPFTAPTPAAAPAEQDKPMQALIVTGHQHPAHLWRDTTVALQEALAQDRRMHVTVVTDPEFLASKNVSSYDIVLLNYCNWQREGLSDAAKQNFTKYLSDGGGLVLVHFTNGAFHASLPETPNSDWPEFRKICRRVWNHGTSSHDAYGTFRVHVTADHPITAGLNSFDTIDELYCNQAGDEPIEVLATARSTVTGKDEPMAFVYEYGRGRVFQTVLGHAAESIRTPGTATLVRRGAAWAARRTQTTAPAPPQEKKQTSAGKLAPVGRFGAALDPRRGAASAARLDAYATRPISVECWARIDSKQGFNILVAHDPKESAAHWELYTYAGAGDLSLYLPGCDLPEIRSGIDIADGKWHYVGAAFDHQRARLYVDGKLAQDAAIKQSRQGGPTGQLFFGGYPPHQIGCDGLVDDVRISTGLRAFDRIPEAPLSADAQTVGLWHFDRIDAGKLEDASGNKNPVTAGETRDPGGPMLTRSVADPALRLVTIDSSPDESFLSIRADTTGRLFVGGREALFVYEPNAHGGYQPRQLLYRFPPDSWVTDVAIRGDDLYVMTNAALYLFEGGRVRRDALVPRRLVWGAPVDLHVTYHGLAWGPEGDLYFSSGDPLLNYGDFERRPDHWGHWTVYTADGAQTKTPYTGMGGFFRCRADASRFQVVAAGTRGSVGIAFDRRWNLFSNDNDHESIAERYSPARLLHAAPKTHFFWPRGWNAAMSPDRSDLVETAYDGLGREVPVGQAYYDDTLLGASYRDSVLMARWGQRRVDGFRLVPRGASFQASEFPILVGAETARPVGVAVGRGGRIFATLSYMAGNEWSPRYPSELVMIAPADDPPTHPFDSYDAVSVAPDRLWSELANPSWSRREQAHVEILRRGGALLSDAIERLRNVDARDPAASHLPWLAAASGRDEARALLARLAVHQDANLRLQALRALTEFFAGDDVDSIATRSLSDSSPAVIHAAIVGLYRSQQPLLDLQLHALVAGPASSTDTYLRQTSAFLLAERASTEQLAALLNSMSAAERLAGVLAAGFRLTVPSPTAPLPSQLPLQYESKNAQFVLDYADARVDLKQLGPVGSFTIAERWKHVPPTAEEKQLFDRLIARLDDPDDRVASQAAYFLSLFDDAHTNPLVAQARRAVVLRRLAAAPRTPVTRAWMIGPLADGAAGFATVHPPEQGPIDLSTPIKTGNTESTWRLVESPSGFALDAPAMPASSYLYLRVAALEPQSGLVCAASPARGEGTAKLWHNGIPINAPDGRFIVALEPGSNDLLIRAAHTAATEPLALTIQAPGRIELLVPEKQDGASLASRLQSAGDAAASVPAEFLQVDWSTAARWGNAERGRKLFSADALACVKCHAIRANQKGGGGPSLSGAAARFTVDHLVESILTPGRQVAPIFAATTIVTDDGRTHTGLVIDESDHELTLLLPSTARQPIAKDTIEIRKLQPTSPMPAGLVRTPDELRDLLAYLLSPNPIAP